MILEGDKDPSVVAKQIKGSTDRSRSSGTKPCLHVCTRSLHSLFSFGPCDSRSQVLRRVARCRSVSVLFAEPAPASD